MAIDSQTTAEEKGSAASTPEFDLTWMSAWQIRELIGDRVITPTEVMEHFLARIEKLDPTLHAFYSIDVDSARAQAAEATRAVEAGEPLGALHGIPTASIDLSLVKGVPNPAFRMESPTFDDIPIERLRDAGAIFIGALNTYFWQPKERPRNPWNLDFDPGNSSRGSAVAVAAGMLPVAVGQDGQGSTRLPAAWSGVIGVQPTRGLVPHTQYEKPSLNLSCTWGPVTRDARDAALMLQVMAGPDGRDIACGMETPPDYSAHLEDGIDGVRVAWTDDYGYSKKFWMKESVSLTAFARDAVFGMAEQGALVEVTDEVWEHPIAASLALGEVFAGALYATPYFMEGYAEREARNDEEWGGSTAAEVIAPDMPTWEEPYRMAVESRKRNWDTFARVFETHDVLISTTTPLPQQTLAEWGLMSRHYLFGGYSAHTAFHNLLGLPAVTVPIGLLEGLPVGVQVTAPAGREDLILRVVQAIQDANPIAERPAAAD